MSILMNALNHLNSVSLSDFFWSVVAIVAVVLIASLFVEKPTRPIQWDHADGDWPNVGGPHE